MSTVIENGDKLIIHPGYYIQELIDANGSSLESFAQEFDIPLTELNDIVHGDLSISSCAAKKLAHKLGTSENYWINLQNAYDTGLKEKRSAESSMSPPL